MPASDPNFEQRLESLRAEAARAGRVDGRGVDVSGGPIPATRGDGAKPGYYGLPVIKPPVWTWEIPVYFFVGGLSGMAGVIAAAAWFSRHPEVARGAMWLAAAGGMVSPVLLIMDLGRPMLFLNMLRVFKHRSAMSMGAWILSVFSSLAVPGALLAEALARGWVPAGGWTTLAHAIEALLILGTAFSGMLLATYTGVLLGATAVPAWFAHGRLLPIHFGTAGLGSAAGALELLGYHLPALNAIGWLAATVETVLWAMLEFGHKGPVDRALHEGASGATLRLAEIITGPLSLVLRFFWRPGAAAAFLIGAFLSRLGWLAAGRASARDPEATFASQRPKPPSAN